MGINIDLLLDGGLLLLVLLVPSLLLGPGRDGGPEVWAQCGFSGPRLDVNQQFVGVDVGEVPDEQFPPFAGGVGQGESYFMLGLPSRLISDTTLTPQPMKPS